MQKIKNIEKYEDYSQRCNYDCYSKSIIFLSDDNEPVKSIHDGRVVLVNSYDDLNMIIIKYGQYFLAYSNLTNPKIQKGDWVLSGTVIGFLERT